MTPMLARIGTAASSLLMGRLPVSGLTGGGADMATIKPSRAEPSRAEPSRAEPRFLRLQHGAALAR